METRDGQQSGVVAKNRLNVVPSLASSSFTAGICATEATSRSSTTIVTKFGRLCAVLGETHNWLPVVKPRPSRRSKDLSSRTISRADLLRMRLSNRVLPNGPVEDDR